MVFALTPSININNIKNIIINIKININKININKIKIKN